MQPTAARENGRVPYLLIALGAYLLGSIPSGYLIGRARGVDLRTAGSGNIGATNALRVLGKKWGYVCLACDLGKGCLAVLLARTVVADALDAIPAYAGITAAACVIVGHNFPVWLGFKGGKGIATSGGVALGLFPWPAFVAALLAWLLMFLITRYVSLASIAAAIMLPTSLTVLWLVRWPGGELVYAILAAVLAVMAIWRHRSNIQRLAAGTEPRFVRKK